MLVEPMGIVSDWHISVDENGRGSMDGAVYQSSGELVFDSLRRVPPQAPVQTAMTPRIPKRRPAQQLSGMWLYCGNWNRHFGHFIMEPLTRLSQRPDRLEGLIFHPNRSGPQQAEVLNWQKYLMSRAGFDLPVLVTDSAVQVESLAVSKPEVVIEESVSEAATRVWQRVAFPSRSVRKVFLSRSRLQARRKREVKNDGQLDDVMMELGFDVVHPQELSLEDQLQVMADAQVLAGVSGSALHQSVFGGSDMHVIEIGDLRSRNSPLPTQRLVDSAQGRPRTFVPYKSADDPLLRDLESVRTAVADALDDAL